MGRRLPMDIVGCAKVEEIFGPTFGKDCAEVVEW